jgi:hypothetical protein
MSWRERRRRKETGNWAREITSRVREREWRAPGEREQRASARREREWRAPGERSHGRHRPRKRARGGHRPRERARGQG